jgi:hypothetical protein
MAVEVKVIHLKTETTGEMLELLDRLGMRGGLKHVALDMGEVLPLAKHKPFDESVKEFFARLQDTQRRLVNHLAMKTAGQSDEELCSTLGLKGNQALAGILGAITKHAEAVGLKAADILISTKKPKHYRLTPRLLEFLQQ